MAYAAIANDQTVGDLASRLYGVGPRSKVARAAAQELLALNPELKKIKELPEGTLVQVPELEDAETKHRLPDLPEAASGSLVAGLRVGTDALEDALVAQADEARGQANARLKTLQSAAVKKAAAKQENGREQLANATAAADAMAAGARGAKAEWRKAAADLRRDLDKLLAVIADPT
jgi:hypothetical protein